MKATKHIFLALQLFLFVPAGAQQPRNVENGHEFVDLGLSVNWGTCNVGADKPEDYGDYYAWGETEIKSTYNWSTYKYCNGAMKTMTKYCNDDSHGYEGFTDNKTTLDLDDDVSHVKWGGNWRMPTESEFKELLDNCTWTWISQNGIDGYMVTSNKTGYTDSSIFLPAAGRITDAGPHGVGDRIFYWSSSVEISFCSGANFLAGSYISDLSRSNGYPIRPVFPKNDMNDFEGLEITTLDAPYHTDSSTTELKDKEESRILKHGSTTDSIVEHFNYKSGEFVRDKVTTYTFDRQARLISQKTERVDTLNPVFPKILIKEYSYDRNGRVKKIMEGDYWNDTTPFEKAFKSKLHYDNNSIYKKTYIIIHYSKRHRKYLVPRKELYAISKSYLDEQGRIILSETDYLTQ